jgi:hypothetical protein
VPGCESREDLLGLFDEEVFAESVVFVEPDGSRRIVRAIADEPFRASFGLGVEVAGQRRTITVPAEVVPVGAFQVELRGKLREVVTRIPLDDGLVVQLHLHEPTT